MSETAEFPAVTWRERMREKVRPRAAGLALALLLEVLLLLLLFSLGISGGQDRDGGEVLTSFDARDFAEPASETPEQAEQPAEAPPLETAQPAEQEEQPLPVPPPIVRPQPDRPSQPALIEVPREDMVRFDIAPTPAPAPAPAAPVQGPMGPPGPGSGGSDTPRMGTAPNGEPLYAAAWYREPRDGELRGYLSTAQGPGWGLIACRTVPDYRVEDCVMIDEYPMGSNIARSVLAAAWQFRVRPPRIGGRVLVGEWVGIRIDYGTRRE